VYEPNHGIKPPWIKQAAGSSADFKPAQNYRARIASKQTGSLRYLPAAQPQKTDSIIHFYPIRFGLLLEEGCRLPVIEPPGE
jgi:hypothetical protein